MRECTDIMNMTGHPVRVKYYMGVGVDKTPHTMLIGSDGLKDAPAEVLNSSHFKALSGATTKNAKVLDTKVRVVQDQE